MSKLLFSGLSFNKRLYFINAVFEILMTVRKGIQIFLQKLVKFQCRFCCVQHRNIHIGFPLWSDLDAHKLKLEDVLQEHDQRPLRAHKNLVHRTKLQLVQSKTFQLHLAWTFSPQHNYFAPQICFCFAAAFAAISTPSVLVMLFRTISDCTKFLLGKS